MNNAAVKPKLNKRKQIQFEIEFINDHLSKENLQDILQREFVRYANEKKGFTWLTIKKK